MRCGGNSINDRIPRKHRTGGSPLRKTGVDIDIRIPGKRTQSVTLLSGGEKSMSAIALIFSILLYRPVPFLLLDEVDAALDDTNISLFNRLVKETVCHSQILLITHNKKTMEIADSLYGVTMQKQGSPRWSPSTSADHHLYPSELTPVSTQFVVMKSPAMKSP